MTEIYIDAKVHTLRELHYDTLQLDRSRVSIREVLARQADTVLDAHKNGNDAVTFHIGCWHPQLTGQTAEQIMSASLTLEQARLTMAREYGYVDWAAVEALGELKFDGDFETAVDLVITGKVDLLSDMLASHSHLVTQTSQHPHAATLLHYLAANGVESHRQMTPLNAADVASCLIDAGANVNATANMYGGGSKTIDLLVTSAHPHNAGVVDAVSTILKQAAA